MGGSLGGAGDPCMREPLVLRWLASSSLCCRSFSRFPWPPVLSTWTVRLVWLTGTHTVGGVCSSAGQCSINTNAFPHLILSMLLHSGPVQGSWSLALDSQPLTLDAPIPYPHPVLHSDLPGMLWPTSGSSPGLQDYRSLCPRNSRCPHEGHRWTLVILAQVQSPF